jgi:two-component system, sensor histidine kinase PdtaS
MTKKTTLLFSLLFMTILFAQGNKDLVFNENIKKIENYVLRNQLDSSSYEIAKLKKTNKSNYLSVLDKITSGKSSYSDYYKFIVSVSNEPGYNNTLWSNYINTSIRKPSNKSKIDIDFVKIKWLQISKLRDDASIEEANIECSKLSNYINSFDEKDVGVTKAKLLVSTHQLVLYVIQEDLVNGKKLCLENLKKATDLDDKVLIITFLYHLCDFYLLEQNLLKYIETCEQSLEIEKTLKVKSYYYIGTVIHLVDAYINKGGENDKINHLLEELYHNGISRPLSFSLYAKFISRLNLDSFEAKKIFKQFEVSNLLEFCNEINKSGEKVLNPNDLYQLQREIGVALQEHGFLEEALDYKDKIVLLNKTIYAKNLANSLANFKTEQAVIQKDIELKYVREKSLLYKVIIGLASVSFLVILFVLFRIVKQSRKLNHKNKIIEKALFENKLLLKEVHHRVKNNFQIVSSLLDLQISGIKDEKALELAKDGKNRVKSMALIHEKLYRNSDFLIDFGEYIRSLVADISTTYGKDINPTINIEVGSEKFDIDTAIPLGLIINELITNVYKYGFNQEKQTLDITMTKASNDDYVLKIKDSGPGLPFDFDFQGVKSSGLRLVKRLSRQLLGDTKYHYENGSVFSVQFKDTIARDMIE